MLPSLTASERVLIDLLNAPNPLWLPQVGAQMEAFLSDADELFYGGAAGGGKSDLLIGLAGTSHRHSIIFRRIFPSTRALIERSREVYNPVRGSHGKDSYNESLHLWRLGSGALVEFGSMQYEKDKEVYRGRPHDFYGWDEVTEFAETQFRFVNAWNRSVAKGQRCRVVATGNPPTHVEGRWVVAYWGAWLDPANKNRAQPGELRWYARIEDVDVEVPSGEPIEHKGELLVPRSRTFIPALLTDNPILAATGYGSILQNLPEPLRSQMLKGDFSAGVVDDAWQVIPTEWVRAAMERGKHRGRPDMPMTGLGVDVARGGKDKVVLSPLYGNWFAPLRKIPGRSAPDGFYVATAVAQAAEGESPAIGLDIIGVGSSPFDILTDQNFRVLGINGAAHAEGMDRAGKLKFANVRAEGWWGLREALDPKLGDDIALPDDPELLADLCSPRWSLRTTGILVESKEDIIKRLGRSPDCGDAVVMARYGVVQQRGIAVDFV